MNNYPLITVVMDEDEFSDIVFQSIMKIYFNCCIDDGGGCQTNK